MPLYVTDADHELGPDIPVTTQSMIKTFRMCPREAMYKYNERLSPKIHSVPLTRGKWIHSVLEEFYLGRDWKPVHKKKTNEFSKLMDEEKDKLGDLPREIDLLVASYLWHYGDPAVMGSDWEVLEVEKLIEAIMPNGHLFRGKVDMIVMIDGEIWIVDHKTHKRLPNWEHRMFDEQSTGYVWAARQMGIPVKGFIWNYITTSGFPKYNLLKNNSSFYAKAWDADTTYVAFARAVRQAKDEHGELFLPTRELRQKAKDKLAELKSQRWQGPDVLPTSPFFRRDVLEKDEDLIDRTLKSMMRTSDNMHSYDFSDPDCVERDIRSCEGFFCSFRDLSMADLVQGDSERLKKLNYRKSDPLAYHGDGHDPLKG